MVIEKKGFFFLNIGFGDDVGIWRVPLSMRSCISCLRQKQLSVLWSDFLWQWQYSLKFQVGGMGLGMGVRSKGLMNPLEDRFSYAWVKVIPRSENS